MRSFQKIAILILISFLLTSCKKYLDKKPLTNEVVPERLTDLQALLDNHGVMNEESASSLLELVTDNYYVLEPEFASGTKEEQDNYTWNADAQFPNAWIIPFQEPIYFSNVILDRLKDIPEDEGGHHSRIKGSALFIRALALYNLAQLYAPVYSNENLDKPGMVMRRTSAITTKSERSTVKETYDEIISDLKESASKLPETTNFPTRPNKSAAHGLLARVYLSMSDYENAGLYADSFLMKFPGLLNFNDLDPNAESPIEHFNKEVIFYSYLSYLALTDPYYAKVDSTLYNSYNDDDLRKTVFFGLNPDGSHFFKGSYDGTWYVGTHFNGVAPDEMYLIKAESAARTGDANVAMEALNTLLETRWKAGTYTPIAGLTADQALDIVLAERRKELLFRGLRWTDLRRYNANGANITLRRNINGAEYTLPPGDKRWVLLIPETVISLSGIEQNER